VGEKKKAEDCGFAKWDVRRIEILEGRLKRGTLRTGLEGDFLGVGRKKMVAVD